MKETEEGLVAAQAWCEVCKQDAAFLAECGLRLCEQCAVVHHKGFVSCKYLFFKEPRVKRD